MAAARQEFSDYMGDFFRRTRPDTVVEVGPDVQLRLAVRLGSLCSRYVAVALPEDVQRSQGWYGMHQDMGINVELMAGNATRLSDVVQHADVVFSHNVLLDLTGEDTQLMWAYRRKQKPHTERDMQALGERFQQARHDGFAESMKVASDGHVMAFHRAPSTEPLVEMLTKSDLAVDPARISVTPLLYDDGEARGDAWELVTIDNTQAA